MTLRRATQAVEFGPLLHFLELLGLSFIQRFAQVAIMRLSEFLVFGSQFGFILTRHVSPHGSMSGTLPVVGTWYAERRKLPTAVHPASASSLTDPLSEAIVSAQ